METKTYIKLKDKAQNNFPEAIIVHHSGANPLQTVESIENYHLGLGWDGVGYHYLITYSGEVHKGRPEHINGAHTAQQSMNFKSVGICLLGNFNLEMPSEAQIDALTLLLKDLNGRYPIKEIVPHRRYANKDCFGKKLPDDWASKLLENDTIEEFITVQVPKSKIPIVKILFGVLGIKM